MTIFILCRPRCDASFLYKAALEYPNMHIRVPSPITSSSDSFPLPQFKPLSLKLTAQHEKAASFTSASYLPNSWVPLSAARRDFQFGGPEVFDKWIIDSMMINPREAYVEYNTSVKASLIGFIEIASADMVETDMGKVSFHLWRCWGKSRFDSIF
jgi:hypothetical protein